MGTFILQTFGAGAFASANVALDRGDQVETQRTQQLADSTAKKYFLGDTSPTALALVVGKPVDGLKSVHQKLDELGALVQSSDSTGLSAAFQSVKDELAALTNTVGTLNNTSIPGIQSTLAAIQARLAALPSGGSCGPIPDLGPFTHAVGCLIKKVDDFNDNFITLCRKSNVVNVAFPSDDDKSHSLTMAVDNMMDHVFGDNVMGAVYLFPGATGACLSSTSALFTNFTETDLKKKEYQILAGDPIANLFDPYPSASSASSISAPISSRAANVMRLTPVQKLITFLRAVFGISASDFYGETTIVSATNTGSSFTAGTTVTQGITTSSGVATGSTITVTVNTATSSVTTTTTITNPKVKFRTNQTCSKQGCSDQQCCGHAASNLSDSGIVLTTIFDYVLGRCRTGISGTNKFGGVGKFPKADTSTGINAFVGDNPIAYFARNGIYDGTCPGSADLARLQTLLNELTTRVV